LSLLERGRFCSPGNSACIDGAALSSRRRKLRSRGCWWLRPAKGTMTMAEKIVSPSDTDSVPFGGASSRDGTSNIFLIQDGTSNTVVFSEFAHGGHETDALAHLQILMADHGGQFAINFASGHLPDLAGLHPGEVQVNDILFL